MKLAIQLSPIRWTTLALALLWLSWSGLQRAALAAQTPGHADGTEQAVSKRPPPSAVDISASLRRIQTLFEKEYAGTTQSRKRDLAQALFDKVPDVADEPVDQYVLLMETHRLAIEGTAPELAVHAVEQLDAGWEVDALALRTAAIEGMAARIRRTLSAPLIDEGLALLALRIEREEWDAGEALVETLRSLVSKHGEAAAEDQYRELRLVVERLRDYEAALVKLEKNPDDPKANHTAGTYLCFSRLDFEHGLPYLTNSTDEVLVACARIDLTNPISVEDQIEMADRWLVWSDKADGIAQRGGQMRALTWLQAALDRATGLEREQLEMRVAELELLVNPPEPEPIVAIEPLLEPEPAAPRLSKQKPADRELGRQVDAAVTWLMRHQDPLGFWSSNNFRKWCGPEGATRCNGDGLQNYDVGMTGLALMALMVQANDKSCGDVDGAVARGVNWLMSMQDPGTGQVGNKSTHEYLYLHAVATHAMCRAYRLTPSEALHDACVKALEYLLAARNPFEGWRYENPPNGENDTSITGWMILALDEARLAGFDVPLPDRPEPATWFESAYRGAERWVDLATARDSGRVGYNEAGTFSARIPNVNTHFPPADDRREYTEVLTAIGIKIQISCGTKLSAAIIEKQINLLMDCLPTTVRMGANAGQPEYYGGDMYYFFHGTEALYALRDFYPKEWKRWKTALDETVLPTQLTEGHTAGSWDPNGPWGMVGGRVYSTAMMALTIATPWRELETKTR